MSKVKFKRLPDGYGRILSHKGRRTFVTFADECGINPTAARQIVGHSSGDVHVSVYTKHSPEYLLSEIKKLKYF